MLEHLYDTAVDFHVPAHKDSVEFVKDDTLDNEEDEVKEVKEVDL